MKRGTLFSIGLLAVLCLVFVWAQSGIIQLRTGNREDEKILMLSDRPEVTRTLALGFDGALSDVLWVRAIQYFGGNFSSLNKPEKRAGYMNLFRNMVGLDHRFVSAYQFGGFVINESMRDSKQSIDFLLEGASYNPKAWRLTFDAAFIAFYQLKDYQTAKMLFLESIYGLSLSTGCEVQAVGLLPGSSADALVDGDPDSAARFDSKPGSITIDLGKPQTIGRITTEFRDQALQAYTLSYGNELAAFQAIESVSSEGFFIHKLNSPIQTRYVKLDHFRTTQAEGAFSLSEVKVYGPANPDTPAYVERMAYEMDRAAGRFKAAWFQYFQYFKEAEKKGDQISAQLALQKIYEIYTTKCLEILKEAVELYQKDQKKLPTTRMAELVDQGYVQKVIAKKIAEDPNFQEEVMPVLMPKNDPRKILTTWDGKQPHLFILSKNAEGKEEWVVTSRTALLSNQSFYIDSLQRYVNKYKQEKGRLPATLIDLQQESWFNADKKIFDDPLGGEFYLNPANGQVEARNPKY